MPQRLNSGLYSRAPKRPPILVLVIGFYLLAFVGLGWAATNASAQTLSDEVVAQESSCATVSAPLQPTEIDTDLLVQKFDPRQGTLLEVTVPTRMIHLDTHAAFENTAQTPVVFAETMNYQAIFTPPSSLGAPKIISGSVARVPSQTISAFDGTMDFSGNSSVSQAPVAWDVAGGAMASSDPSILTEFSGSGSVAFRVTTAIGETFTGGGGNVQASITTAASGSVEVCYRFAPPIVPVVEPPVEIIPAAEVVSAAAPSLPRTGAAAGPLVTAGLAAVAIGGGMLLVGRRFKAS